MCGVLFGSWPPQPSREEEVINASKSNFIRVHLSWKEWTAVVSARWGMGWVGGFRWTAWHSHWSIHGIVWLFTLLITRQTTASNKTNQLFPIERTLTLDSDGCMVNKNLATFACELWMWLLYPCLDNSSTWQMQMDKTVITAIQSCPVLSKYYLEGYKMKLLRVYL